MCFINRIFILVLMSIWMLGIVSSYAAPDYDNVNFSLCSGYVPPLYSSTNFSLGDNDDCGAVDINYSSNVGGLKFLNCSPDWEFYPTAPSSQTSTISAINATNNGTAAGEFQIKYIGSINTGWTLFSCNDTSTDPDNDADCITMSDSFQTIWNNVSVNETKRIWLYGNCSYISANPGVSTDMQAV